MQCGHKLRSLTCEGGTLDYPELEIDWHKYPNLADNTWHAQMAGWPHILTYSGPDLIARRANRRAAMRYEHDGESHRIPRILSRDEYPLACTDEGGSVWVGHIPGVENSAQGGTIAAFLRRHLIVAGRGEFSKFKIKVVNHPRGPVTTPPQGVIFPRRMSR
jgi:hypothetical protein